MRGIFGSKVGTKSITCAALQAEASTDFAEAVKLYNEVNLMNVKRKQRPIAVMYMQVFIIDFERSQRHE